MTSATMAFGSISQLLLLFEFFEGVTLARVSLVCVIDLHLNQEDMSVP